MHPLRDPELEQAILAAPDDPAPRLVYGDWLQHAGDRRGEWVALSAAADADPANVAVRRAAIAFLERHAGDVLGDAGAVALPHAWIGWRAGFVEELRLQSGPGVTAATLADLLAHPAGRFVRHLGLGLLDDGPATVAAVIAAAPPLLETLVLFDGPEPRTAVPLGALSRLPALRRLGLDGGEVTEPLPGLTSLFARSIATYEWIAGGGCPNVTELTLDFVGMIVDRETPRPYEVLPGILRALPRLRSLRLTGIYSYLDDVIRALVHAPGLERIDLSHAGMTADSFDRLAEVLPALREILALHSSGAPRPLPGIRVVASVSRHALDEDEPPSWWSHRLAEAGRDALQLIPGAGGPLSTFAMNLMQSTSPGRCRAAAAALAASVTYPTRGLGAIAWTRAAAGHARIGDLDAAELYAREGLLRAPADPSCLAIALEMLRRNGRLDDALALLPRTRRALEAPAAPGAAEACLLDMLLACAQAGRHHEVVALAAGYAALVRPAASAVVAMSLVALGRAAEAGTALERARLTSHGVLHHATAVVALAAGRPDVAAALQRLEAAHAAGYPEWPWIVRGDPNLAAVAGEPRFRALIARAVDYTAAP